MKINVYAPVLTETSAGLIKALNADRLIKFDGMNFLRKGRPVNVTGETIVCWGRALPTLDGCRVLNGSAKYVTQLELNQHARSRAANFGVSFAQVYPYASMKAWSEALDALASGKLMKKGNGIPIKELPGYFTLWTNYAGGQYKVHVFDGKCILTGFKQNGANGNWTYDNVNSPVGIDNTAVVVVKSLGLTFGVVTVGIVDRFAVARKIVTTPVLTQSQIELYAKCINVWATPEPVAAAMPDTDKETE